MASSSKVSTTIDNLCNDVCMLENCNDLLIGPFHKHTMQSHTIEHFWVERNQRVNYSLKGVLIQMLEAGMIQ